jgi:hypothetical protein
MSASRMEAVINSTKNLNLIDWNTLSFYSEISYQTLVPLQYMKFLHLIRNLQIKGVILFLLAARKYIIGQKCYYFEN